MKKTTINWEFYNNLPLISTNNAQGVLDLLGIPYDKRSGKFLCPFHDDHSPSAKIMGENNEKFICYVCNTSGTALNLVSQIKEISTKEAAFFLNEYFPGGMEINTEVYVAPVISATQLKALGLKKNPFQPVFEKAEDQKVAQKFSLETSDACAMLLDKIDEYRLKNLKYVENIFKNFPQISSEDKKYMQDKIKQDIQWSLILKEKIKEYDSKIATLLLEDIQKKSNVEEVLTSVSTR